MKNIQDFIEQYFPNYYSSQEVAEEADLHRIVFEKNNIQEGSSAEIVLNNYSQEDFDNNQPKIDWLEARVNLLEKSIQNFNKNNKILQ